MRKPTFCICENKYADQLRGDREADQRLCFRYIGSTISLLSKSEISSLSTISCSFTVWFLSGHVGNPEDRVSHNEAHLVSCDGIMLTRLYKTLRFFSSCKNDNFHLKNLNRTLYIFAQNIDCGGYNDAILTSTHNLF